jgi:hypothetical protein
LLKQGKKMKKLNIILMILALLLSIGVRSAPVESSGAKVSFAALIIGLSVATIGVGVVAIVLNEKEKKEALAKKRKKKRKKKAVKAALRKRAEIEYDHRHASHKWQ